MLCVVGSGWAGGRCRGQQAPRLRRRLRAESLRASLDAGGSGGARGTGALQRDAPAANGGQALGRTAQSDCCRRSRGGRGGGTGRAALYT
eukprot:3561046-Pleurochrysis_carterae.AAC.1